MCPVYRFFKTVYFSNKFFFAPLGIYCCYLWSWWHNKFWNYFLVQNWFYIVACFYNLRNGAAQCEQTKFNFFIRSLCACVCMCTQACAHHINRTVCMQMVKSNLQVLCLSFHCAVPGFNQIHVHYAWQQVTLPVEPSHKNEQILHIL